MPSTGKRVAIVALYTIFGAMAATLIGYLLGAAAGVAMTLVNNHMEGTPGGSYLFWANFCGTLAAFFAWIPGGIAGVVWGSIKQFGRRADVGRM
jgi:hypothetical protein